MVAAPVRRLWFAVLCGYLALGAALQTLPAWTASRFESGAGMTGVIVAAANFAAMLVRPVAGRQADHRGPRRVVAVGAAVSSVAAVLHLLAPSLAVLLLARLLLGAGEGVLFTGAITWISRATPSHRTGTVVGRFGLSMWAGLAAGPMVAGWAADLVGLSWVWTGVCLLPLTALLLVIGTPRTAIPAAPLTAAGPLLPAAARRPGLILALASFGYGTLAAFLVTRMRQLDLTGASWALTLVAVAFLTTRLFASPLIDRTDVRVLAAITLAIEATGLTAIAFASTTAALLLGAALTGAGVALAYPITATLLLTAADTRAPGSALGALTSAWDAGLAIAGPVGALALTLSGYPLVFSLASLACLLAAAASSTATRPVRGKALAATTADTPPVRQDR